MVVPFSTGDFISIISLIRTILGALVESNGAASQYRLVMTILKGLENSVKYVETIEYGDEALAAELQQAAERFENSTKTFEDKIRKYEPSLKAGGSSKKWRDTMRKIQWTLNKDDVTAFQAEILIHASNVQLLLQSAHIAATASIKTELVDFKRTMISAEARMETSLADTRSSLALLHAIVSQCAEDFQDSLQALIRLGTAVLNAIMSVQLRCSAPKSICFNQPVTFQDAVGRFFPIHLEWISCWESFEQVLLIQHKNRPGRHAVEHQYYKLQDASTAGEWTEVDKEQPYDQAFQPGRFIDMAVPFPHEPAMDSECPKCGWPEDVVGKSSKIVCRNPDCDTNYSKADNISTNVVTFPAHFELPRLPVIVPEGAKSADAQGQEDDRVSSGPVDNGLLGNDTDGEGKCEDLEEDTNSLLPDTLDHFKNLYITKPPPVILRDRSGRWYSFPWRVVRSYEGMCFLLKYFTMDREALHVLRDRELGNILNADNWEGPEGYVYYGMVIEMTASKEPSEADAQSPKMSRNAPSLLSPTICCHLCGRRFGSERKLGMHVTTHLTSRQCPTPCAQCGPIQDGNVAVELPAGTYYTPSSANSKLSLRLMFHSDVKGQQSDRDLSTA